MKFVILLNAVSAAGFPIIKYLTDSVGSFFLTAFRQLVSGTMMLSFVYFFRSVSFRIAKKDLWLVIGIALSVMSLAIIFTGYAMENTTTARSSFIYNISPFLTALFSYIHFQEVLTTKKVLGLGIAMVGFFPIFLQSPIAGFQFGVGEIFAVLAVGTWSYGWVLMRKFMKSSRYSLLLINGDAMVLGGVFAFIGGCIFEELPSSHVLTGLNILVFMALVVGGLIVYNLYAYLLKKYTVTLLAFAAFLMPLFATLYGWLFFSEPVTFYFYLSSATVLFGLYLFYAEELRQGYTQR